MATTSTRPPAAASPSRRPAAPPPWRERLVPRTVLGMSMVILAAAMGAAFSGAVLYAYYEFRLTQNEDLIQAYDESFKKAEATIEAEGEEAKAEIRKELEPLREIRAEGETLEALVGKVQQSVWFVSTLDEAGQPSVGSAVVVASNNDQTLMLTSFASVRAATRQPGPEVRVRKGDQELRATLWTWHEERDLALLVVARGDIPKLTVAPKDPPLETGERVFAVSGLGASGGSISQGFVADVSSAGIQHDAALGHHFEGAPLLNSKGEVLGIASTRYAPLGFTTRGVTFAVPIRAACERVLKCPGGELSGGAGDRR